MLGVYWLNGNQSKDRRGWNDGGGTKDGEERSWRRDTAPEKWVNKEKQRKVCGGAWIRKWKKKEANKSACESWRYRRNHRLSVQPLKPINSDSNGFQTQTNSSFGVSWPDPPLTPGIEFGLPHYTVAMGTLTLPLTKCEHCKTELWIKRICGHTHAFLSAALHQTWLYGCPFFTHKPRFLSYSKQGFLYDSV